ncbi:hypothetical protein GCM10010244_56260 [Streptomyces coeruleorubidus]|nr:hypothetical protein GCM10010244_56260 [Streptomyces bellus]
MFRGPGPPKQLVVSELVTNARKYAPGPVLIKLRISGDGVEAVVWDSDPVLLVARAADAGRVGQHGLEIVMAVAQGLRGPARAGGQTHHRPHHPAGRPR